MMGGRGWNCVSVCVCVCGNGCGCVCLCVWKRVCVGGGGQLEITTGLVCRPHMLNMQQQRVRSQPGVRLRSWKTQ